MQENARWTFAGFELDLATHVLLRPNGELVRIGAQPFRALALLVSRGGDLVTREELQKEIWGNRVHVDFDHGLSVCIGQIRGALGRQQSKQIIVTCPRQGYRLGVPVTRVVDIRWPSRWKWGASAAAVASIAAAYLLAFPVMSRRAAFSDAFFSVPTNVTGLNAEPRSGPSLPLIRTSFLHPWSTGNPQAYAWYWRGRAYFDRETGKELVGAFRYFEKATSLDPSFAPAYSGLAVSYLELAARGTAPAESAMNARRAAQRALALDARFAETHVALAELRYRLDNDDPGAEREFVRAVELDDRNAFVRQRYALFLQEQRRFDEALEQLRVAQELDPLSVVSYWQRASTLFLAGRYEESLAQGHLTLELDPNHLRSFRTIGLGLEAIGKRDDAIEAYLKAGRLGLGHLGHLYAVAGRYDEAREILTVLTRQPLEEAGHNGVAIAFVYAGLGETDKAMQWLERAHRAGVRLPFALRVAPQWADFRAKREFREFLKTASVPGV
jgi:DNA-binding winged helix-turn-helix (wHTH) protein/tetratricopeptide (TPR) repeat protein